ncbi:DUF7344 domain-containing protein [Halorussus salinisoli]|uniref:DUF7344 domain-containing protein n=1 Tax=Halorussus salinisoli TaxID=2558242 RepID=UPI0010C1FBBD|nr:hypothetical protein [Halorussus salinisoli]
MDDDGISSTLNCEKQRHDRTTGEETGQRLDRTLVALSEERRRLVLQYFRNASDDVATMADLADYVANRTESSDFEYVSVALHHKDVPKLEEAGLIEYDSRSETVRFVGSEFVYSLLDSAEGRASSEQQEVADGTDVVRHLSEALTVEDPVEKDYHVRQALQHVHLDP